ncbi:trypsin-like peptidase domain-containing protein [Conexibacter stalactiti]|uniref:Trypsin-like peptidase domain-containing protein n=1 Tax=Conexibacter stalactiti TaxID=1940611 RepID=A0ABU4HRN4_9ACTN|nr:trypsin-like peptidase domain-containing protein [Conexibacter stalactiti]MDW5595971.1 trypsin-like peptidase domain-containing protein [Conexibacter stalactiti]MEC5036613.1 trypsin-like peptidase domain-containing protein [Conexibacter stalactiti]
MRALVRSPFVTALAGGAIVAVALLALGVAGRERTTTTVIEQARVAGGLAGTAADQRWMMSAHEVYERDAPGVVYVHADPRTGSATTGTGFVIDRDGHLLTNSHVVGDARTVKIRFGEDRTVVARVLGRDVSSDLALLKVDPDAVDLHPLTLGDSSDCRVGDPVIAIGNPYGLERTLTTGVVSALQRQLRAPNGFTIQHVIQTDTPIGAGNSGGPLIDAGGRVVGITSQIAADGSSGTTDISFAIPINTVKDRLTELKETGGVVHPYIGISAITLDDRLASLRLPVKRGVLVQSVHPGGPAAAAGVSGGTIESQVEGEAVLLGGDVITALDGRTVRSMGQLTRAIADRKPGDEIKLGILRNGESLQLVITLGKAPGEAPADDETP